MVGGRHVPFRSRGPVDSKELAKRGGKIRGNKTRLRQSRYHYHTMGPPSCLLPSFLLLSVASISFSSSMTAFLAPHFPSHFTADVHILSHLITPDMQTDGYPPSSRHLHLSYNREHGGMARIDEGIISYVRRFDLKQEYKIFLVLIFNPSIMFGIDLSQSYFEKCFISLSTKSSYVIFFVSAFNTSSLL